MSKKTLITVNLNNSQYTDLNHTEEALDKDPISLLKNSPQTFLESAYKSQEDPQTIPRNNNNSNQIAHQ